MNAPKKLKGKKLAAEISRLYKLHGNYVVINMMDLGKVYKAGEDANEAGADMEAAIKDAIEKYAVKA